MKKNSGDTIRRVSGGSGGGGDIDERGKFRNKEADDGGGRGSSILKTKKKKKAVERVALVIEDNTYKKGSELKKKKRKTPVTIEGTAVHIKEKKKKPKASTEIAVLPKVASAAAMKKKAKGKQQVMQAVEAFVELPPVIDEFDAESRRIFENLIHLASRFEEQMEDRIYNKDVYALNVIYSQIREVIADLRATRDISAQIAELESIVMRPYQMVVAQSLTDLYFHIDGAVSKFVKDSDMRIEIQKKLKNTLSECAENLQSEYGLAIDRARKVLL